MKVTPDDKFNSSSEEEQFENKEFLEINNGENLI